MDCPLCGIPFHATDCESNHGDYKNIPKEENKAMYRDLAGILASSLLGGIGIAIDLAAQKQIIPGALPLAYYRALLECVERVANVAENSGEIADLTFDISTENEYNARLLYAWARNGDTRLVSGSLRRFRLCPGGSPRAFKQPTC